MDCTELNKETFKKNKAALKLLRRSYKSRKDYASGLRNYTHNCPLCHHFNQVGAKVPCTGCIWQMLDKHKCVYACKVWAEQNLPAGVVFDTLKYGKKGKRDLINIRLAHLKAQLKWLRKHKPKRGRR